MQVNTRSGSERKKIFVRTAAVLLPLAAVLLMLAQTAFAQTTYVITDGSRVFVHTTSATDPEAVLGEAGLKLGDDDTYTTSSDTSGVSEIQVRRGQEITIDYYGETMQAQSFGETVEELLGRLNLSWGAEDFISLPLGTETFDGMELTVAKVVHENQSYSAAVPYETVLCSDPNLPEGQQKILTRGEDGEALCHAAVTYVNGIEKERRVISEYVVSHPTNQVVAVGCGPKERQQQEQDMPVIGDGTITLPSGEVLSYWTQMFAGATAYHCEGYQGTTATGTVARVGAIAVDPTVIPYGTRMFIVTNDGEYVYGLATAEDCGSPYHIFGDRIDLFFDTEAECIEFGYRECTIYFLG